MNFTRESLAELATAEHEARLESINSLYDWELQILNALFNGQCVFEGNADTVRRALARAGFRGTASRLTNGHALAVMERRGDIVTRSLWRGYSDSYRWSPPNEAGRPAPAFCSRHFGIGDEG